MLGIISSIEEVNNLAISGGFSAKGSSGVNLGMSGMLNSIVGRTQMDGYKVVTDKHTYHILIDNGQCCCESWGYMSSEDEHETFIGAELMDVTLTDKALNEKKVKQSDYYEDDGGIQFVNFKTGKGLFQLAVYNGHNGYYGHGIIVARDDEILLDDVL